jgi:hypothetical protein
VASISATPDRDRPPIATDEEDRDMTITTTMSWHDLAAAVGTADALFEALARIEAEGIGDLGFIPKPKSAASPSAGASPPVPECRSRRSARPAVRVIATAPVTDGQPNSEELFRGRLNHQ